MTTPNPIVRPLTALSMMEPPKTPRYVRVKSGPLAGRVLSESDLYTEAKKADPNAQHFSPSEVFDSYTKDAPDLYEVADEPTGSYFAGMMKNIPGSAGRLVANAVVGIPAGIMAVAGAAKELYDTPMEEKPGKLFNQVKHTGGGLLDFYKSRYGGGKEIAETLRNDPVGVVGDAATVASLPSLATRTAGRAVSIAGKVASKAPIVSRFPSAVNAMEKTAQLGDVVRGAGVAAEVENAGGVYKFLKQQKTQGVPSIGQIPQFVGETGAASGILANKIDPVGLTLRGLYGSTHKARESAARGAYRSGIKFPNSTDPKYADKAVELAFNERITQDAAGAKTALGASSDFAQRLDEAIESLPAGKDAIDPQFLADLSEEYNKLEGGDLLSQKQSLWKEAKKYVEERTKGQMTLARENYPTKGKSNGLAVNDALSDGAGRFIPVPARSYSKGGGYTTIGRKVNIPASNARNYHKGENQHLSDLLTRINTQGDSTARPALAARLGLRQRAKQGVYSALENSEIKPGAELGANPSSNIAAQWEESGQRAGQLHHVGEAIERKLLGADQEAMIASPWYVANAIRAAANPLSLQMNPIVASAVGGLRWAGRHAPGSVDRFLFNLAQKHPGRMPSYWRQAGNAQIRANSAPPMTVVQTPDGRAVAIPASLSEDIGEDPYQQK